MIRTILFIAMIAVPALHMSDAADRARADIRMVQE